MDTFDFILLSYEKGLINDNDFLLLCRSYLSQKLDLPLSCFLYNGLQVLQLEYSDHKTNNTDKKLDFGTGRVFVICDKSENTKLSVLIKYILRGSA